MDKIIVSTAGFLGITFTYWFFFIKKEKAVSAIDSIDIIVDGGYSPSLIEVRKDKITRINFFRKDSSACLEEIVLSDFKIRKFLPLNKRVTIEISPKKAGEYSFVCGMGMFHGKLIVKR